MELTLNGFEALSFFLLTFASVFFFLGYGSSEWAVYKDLVEDSDVNPEFPQIGVWDACVCRKISDIKSTDPNIVDGLGKLSIIAQLKCTKLWRRVGFIMF